MPRVSPALQIARVLVRELGKHGAIKLMESLCREVRGPKYIEGTLARISTHVSMTLEDEVILKRAIERRQRATQLDASHL